MLVSSLAPTVGSIVGPVLSALITGIGGVFLGKYLSDEAAKKQFVKSLRLEIFQQRIHLAERIVHIIHCADYFQIQQKRLQRHEFYSRPETYVYLIRLLDEYKIKGEFGVEQWRNSLMAEEEVLRIAKEIAEATAEFAAAGSLCSFYFGPKTKEALDRIAKEDGWFSMSTKTRSDLISSLFEEMSTF